MLISIYPINRHKLKLNRFSIKIIDKHINYMETKLIISENMKSDIIIFNFSRLRSIFFDET